MLYLTTAINVGAAACSYLTTPTICHCDYTDAGKMATRLLGPGHVCGVLHRLALEASAGIGFAIAVAGLHRHPIAAHNLATNASQAATDISRRASPLWVSLPPLQVLQVPLSAAKVCMRAMQLIEVCVAWQASLQQLCKVL